MSQENQPQLVGVQLLAEGVELIYAILPRDVRKNGLMWQHSVLVPRGSDYDLEIEAVEEALSALLEDVLEDEATAESVDLVENEDEDED